MIRLSEEPMSLEELAEKTRTEKRKVYRILSSLHKSNQIIHFRDEDGVRRYRPFKETRKARSEGSMRSIHPPVKP